VFTMFERKTTILLAAAFAAVLLASDGVDVSGVRPGPGPEIDLASEACTVILVGREASTDGSVMSTHAADCGVCDFTWRHVPAADHKLGAMRKL